MEEGKNKKKKISLVLLILGIILIGVGLYFSLGNKDNKQEGNSRPSIKDDFYNYVNYDTISKAAIPSDSSDWSHWYDVSKTIEDRTKELMSEILLDPEYKNEDIDNLIELMHDYEGRNTRGYDELKPYFNMIDNAKTMEDINKIVLKFDEDLGVNVFIVGATLPDLDDKDKNVFAFDEIGDFKVFVEDEYARSREIGKKLFDKVMTILGYDRTKQNDVYNKYVDFAKKVYEKSIKENEISDIGDLWKKYTIDQLSSELKNLPIKRYLENRGIGSEEYYIMTDIGHYKAVDEFYTIDNLDLIKELLRINLVTKFLQFTSEENEQFLIDISNELGGTKITLKEFREQNELGIKAAFIGDEVQKRYEKKYFSEEDRKIVADLVEEIRNNYKDVINSSDWLSNETKTRAISKLDKMKVNIGYQETNNDKDYYVPIPKAKGGTLFKYIIESNRYAFKKSSEEFHKKAETEKLNTLDVNASYQPQDNSINFSAGYKGLYENETDYYKKLAYFGTVIAHEISHAFDNQGSKFDENGKYNDWWTVEDRANYEKLEKKIEDYFSKYEVEGFKVDGHQTVGENIADLAGMKSIITIMEKKGATREDFKNFFEAYADLWATKSTKEGIENQILEDPHSPNIIRVNGVLSSMDKFYEVYDIKEGDKMFIPKEERVGLW